MMPRLKLVPGFLHGIRASDGRRRSFAGSVMQNAELAFDLAGFTSCSSRICISTHGDPMYFRTGQCNRDFLLHSAELNDTYCVDVFKEIISQCVSQFPVVLRKYDATLFHPYSGCKELFCDIEFQFQVVLRRPLRRAHAARTPIETWLILPVVICLSQRLSHACLSISL